MASTPFTISRTTILCPEDGDAPRSRSQLNALRALGAVLNKPEWWTKWTTKPDVRARWLQEIGDALVATNVSQVLTVWPNVGNWQKPKVFGSLLDVARLPAEDPEKQAKIQALLANVMYPPAQYYYDSFVEGGKYESDDDTAMEITRMSDDDEEEQQPEPGKYIPKEEAYYDPDAVHTNFKKVFQHHKKKNPFCQIAWYVNMSLFQQKLRSLSFPDQWDPETVGALVDEASEPNNPQVIDQTRAVIVAVLLHTSGGGACTNELVQVHFPSETRVNVLKLLRLHFRKVHAFVETTKRDVSHVLDLLTQKLKLGASDNANPQTIRPGPVRQTWLSDTLISAELKTKFLSQIALLENVPEPLKDWHPNTDNQVLDLVHPSLFCGVKDRTKVLLYVPAAAGVDLHSSAADHMRSIMFAPTTSVLTTPKTTQFQWLPSEVDVDDHGQATIRTYINNLHPEIHGDGLYKSISSIFSQFVPLFDHVVSSLDHKFRFQNKELETEITQSIQQELNCDDTSASRLPRLVPLHLFDPAGPQFSLKGTRCQVIVKIAEILLTPGKPTYAGGSWHVEGTDAERIVATGLYYFGCENITESNLSFRVFVNEPDYDQSDNVGVGLAYGLFNEELLIQNVGSVTALEDRCVVFPNIFQHKVEPFQLEDPSRPGSRKILAFFLVDPTNEPIASTAVVPPQQQEWIERVTQPEINKLGFPEVVAQQLHDLTRQGMTLDQAKEIRLQLMDERSPPQYEEDEEAVFSLCEH